MNKQSQVKRLSANPCSMIITSECWDLIQPIAKTIIEKYSDFNLLELSLALNKEVTEHYRSQVARGVSPAVLGFPRFSTWGKYENGVLDPDYN